MPLNGGKAFDVAVVKFDDHSRLDGEVGGGKWERVEAALLNLLAGQGDGQIERRHRIGQLLAQAPHLRVDVRLDLLVDLFQNQRLDRVEDERSDRVDDSLRWNFFYY